MGNKSRERGQNVIEFALVLPIFSLFLFGILFVGMVMADYLLLSSIARSSAREAAVISSADYYENNYEKIRLKYKDMKLPMDIYSWQATKTDNFTINYDSNSQNVQVIMKADLNKTGSYLGTIVNRLAGGTNFAHIDITYSMYSEYTPK